MDDKELIKQLQDKIKLYEEDSLYSLFFSINRKNNEIARSLNSTTIDITGDDKSWERYIGLQKGLKDMVETADWLRRDYLKIEKDEIEEKEKKGTPALELYIKNRKK